MEVFLDSGAYSAYYQKKPIDIDKYIEYVYENFDYVDYYANLDIIGDQEGTYKNWLYMKKKGLSPMPVFHAGRNRNPKHLQHYLEESEYIALGAIAKMNTKERIRNLDNVWYSLTDTDGNPLVKCHGFGLTSFPLMERYPWYSVDSIAWILQGGSYGHMWFPYYDGRTKKYDYSKSPICVDVGRDSTKVNSHFYGLSKVEQRQALDYLDMKGFSYGKSEFKYVKDDYKLEKNELWADENNNLVEVVIEEGLCNSHMARCRFNLEFYLDKYKYDETDRRFDKRVCPLFGKGVLSVGSMDPVDVGHLKIFAGGMDSATGRAVLDEYNYEYRLTSYWSLSKKSEGWLKEFVLARRKNEDKQG